MRVLFLDDNESRYRVFRQTTVGTGITHIDWAADAKTAVEMLLDNPRYDIICFDHDLSEEHQNAYITDGEDADYGDTMTGYDVAIFVVTELEPVKQPQYAIVHTFNHIGARRITSTINEGGYQKYIYVFPFSQDGFHKTFEHIKQNHGN